MIRFIHISDLHLECETPLIEKTKIISALANDLIKFVNENSILVFTGDLIDKGGYSFKNKENIFQSFQENFIKVLIDHNPSLKGKIFIVPGNHDIFRNKIDEFSEIGIKTKLTDSKSLSQFIIENRTNSKHVDRLEDYKNWEKQFYKEFNDIETSNFENSFVLDVDGYKLGITCLNSSWLCKDDSDKENLLIGKNKLKTH